jgi:signal transduction histidine kinase
MTPALRQSPLLWKIWSTQCLVTALIVAAVCIGIDYFLMAVMTQFNFTPQPIHDMFTGRLHLIARVAGVSGAGLAAVVCFFAARGIVTPLREIVEMTGRVAEGDRMVKIPAEGTDEVATLGRAFNELVDRLEQKDELQKALIANVAHELRTPLTNIRGYLEALTDEVMPPSKEVFVSLQEETLVLTKVVDNLFELAEANSVAATLALEPIQISDLFARVIAVCRRRIEAKRIQIETRIGPGAEMIHADGRILRALRNLVQNAIEHVPENGTVRMAAESLPDSIRVLVSDDGDGIDGQDIPFIFDRFFRGRRRPTGEVRGVGLGLAIVKELVVAHGGRVGAERMDKGAAVWFSLPKA